MRSSLFCILILILYLHDLDAYSFCPCVVFNSSGTFHSPNYPSPLQDVECVFYHFQAPPDHIVLITFNSFSLPPRLSSCPSSVLIYDDSVDGFVDSGDSAQFEFCGREIQTGKNFYSRNEHLLLQIVHKTGVSKGFVGDYRFIPKSNFTNTALEISECSFRVEKTKGVLYSPNFPYFYPSHINCTYILPQRKGSQITLISNEFNLGKDGIFDVFETNQGKNKIQSLTSTSRSLYISSSYSLLLHFQAGKNDKDRARGFLIEFTYEGASLAAADPSSAYSDCSFTITSDEKKTGNFSTRQLSTKATSSLPSKCRIVLQGFPNEKVSVKFTYFNLYVAENKNVSKRCGELDHVTADVRTGSRLSRIDEWCADRPPPPLMSSTNLLQLEYTTMSTRTVRDSAEKETGFQFEYRFHTDWAMEHMMARVDKTKSCRFLFNSSAHSSGKLFSVNYPGFYPRNIYCEYIFHGNEDQIVHIHFEYFDVEGFNQCDETTQSDFVLFSNYQTHDRTNRRFCGKVAPKGPILSESNYFRMIFSTNDIFDATGFYAHFQFITQQKAQISRVKLTTTSTTSSPSPLLPLLSVMMSFLLCSI